MKKVRPTILIAFGLLITVSFVWLGLRSGRPEGTDDTLDESVAASEGEVMLSEESQAYAGVKVETVEIGVVEEIVEAVGEVVPDTDKIVKVSSLVSGRVSVLYANIGDSVKAGQRLATVDSPEVAQARARYREAQARLEAAQKALSNLQELAQAGVFTQKRVDELRRERAQVASEVETVRLEYESEVNSSRAAVKVVEAAYRTAGTDWELAQAELERQKQLAEAGAFSYHPLEEAQKAHAEAVAALEAAKSEFAYRDSQLERAQRLLEIGTAAVKDVEAARAARAATEAALRRTEEQARITKQVLDRQQQIFEQRIYTSREIQVAETELQRASRGKEQAAADLEQSRTRLQLAESPQKKQAVTQMEERLRVLDSLLTRETDISKRGLGARQELLVAEREVQAAQVEVSSARDALSVLHASPSDTTSGLVPIYAPIPGRVVECNVNRGQVVGPEQEIFTILALDAVWVHLQVYQADLPKVKKGQPVRLLAKPFPSTVFPGYVDYVSDELAETTRTVTVRCVIPNPQRLLKPEMSVTGEIITARREGAVVISDIAVQSEEEESLVFVERTTGRYQRRPVQLGYHDERSHQVEVTSGLAAGERIVTEGAFYVRAASAPEELEAEGE